MTASQKRAILLTVVLALAFLFLFIEDSFFNSRMNRDIGGLASSFRVTTGEGSIEMARSNLLLIKHDIASYVSGSSFVVLILVFAGLQIVSRRN